MILPVFAYLLLLWTVVVYSQQNQQTAHASTSIPSVWDYVSQNGSKTISAEMHGDLEKTMALALSQPNITFFLPVESAIARAVNTSVLDFADSNRTQTQLLRHLVLHVHDFGSLLRARHYLSNTNNDLSTVGLPLVVGPSPQNQSTVQVSSGISTANILNSMRCSNGIVHLIDHFLTPPLTTLKSIEQISDLETHEMLMKSLNLTTVVSGPNKTVLAPINQAWAAANSSTMPYGTLVHSLKYQVIDGIYMLDALYPDQAAQNVSLLTSRRDSYLYFGRNANNNNELLVVGKQPSDVARIVRSDIITSEGVIHLVDKVLSADLDVMDTDSSREGGPGALGREEDGGSRNAAAVSTGVTNAQSSDKNSASASAAANSAVCLLTALFVLHAATLYFPLS